MNIPKNIEAYYQETGRAGRDGLPADAFMIYGMDDVTMQRQWIRESDAPEVQKNIQQQKLASLLGLCETARCRRQILLEYFGDQCAPCGNCDTCLNPPETFDGTIAAQKALSCVHRTGERFGVMYLIQILLGLADDRSERFGHQQLSVFGVGKEYDKRQWQNIFRQLVAANFLYVNSEQHGGLSITPQGRQFLKNKESVELRTMPKRARASREEREQRRQQVDSQLSDADNRLFEVLKDLRRTLAQAQNIPAYVIFHDKTLMEMVLSKPQTTVDMLQINGVGQSKMDRYGEAFLTAMAQEEVVLN